MPKRPIFFVILLASLAFLPDRAAAQMTPAEQRGRTFAQANCARCHAIDKVSPSPLVIAPPFRVVSEKYPIESLEDRLAQGIVTRHPTMPEFRLEPDQVRDFSAFLKYLAR